VSAAMPLRVPAPPPRSAPRLGGFHRLHLLAPIGLMILGLGFVYYNLGEDRGKVAVVALNSVVACFGAYLAVGRLLPRYYAPRLFIGAFLLQCAALGAIALLGLPLGPPFHPFDVNAADAPVRSVLAMLMVPAGTLAAVAIWRLFSGLSGAVVEAQPEDGSVVADRRMYLFSAAALQLLYWPATLEGAGTIGYVIRVLTTALLAAAFLAGRDSRSDRRLGGVWVAVLVINVVIGVAAGTRAKAFVAIVLFGAGYISALQQRKRWLVGALALAASLPMLEVAGAMGVVRGDTGRGGLELVQTDHVRDVLQQVSRQMSSSNKDDADAIRAQGVGRMLAWTNVVVPILTPDTVPYRGLAGLFDETTQMMKVAQFSGQNAEDLYDADLYMAPARRYGFMVNASTAVEFSVVADAWSRGGAPIALLFCFVATLALLVGEMAMNRFRRWGRGVATILTLPVLKTAFFDSTVLPLLPTIRGMVLSIIAIVLFAFFAELAQRSIRGPVRRRRLARAMARGVAFAPVDLRRATK
jgi:hypothetical protein